jgi:hypothetical protein
MASHASTRQELYDLVWSEPMIRAVQVADLQRRAGMRTSLCRKDLIPTSRPVSFLNTERAFRDLRVPNHGTNLASRTPSSPPA